MLLELTSGPYHPSQPPQSCINVGSPVTSGFPRPSKNSCLASVTKLFTLFKMETNKTDTFNKMVYDNCSCPICFEEFKVPKSLPSCCHSFCEGCLEKMLKRPSVTIPHQHILCPLCQKVSPVSEGITNLPVNPILVELLEHTPAAETRKELYRFLDDCNSELSKSSSQIETIVRKAETFKQHVETQKELVSLTAGMLKEEIDKKANEMLQELNIQADRRDEWTKEYQSRGHLCCSDTMTEYKRFRTLIKNESADYIVNNKTIYMQRLDNLKAKACERATNLLEEANVRMGNNDKWPRFIANEKLTETLEEFKIGYLDTDGKNHRVLLRYMSCVFSFIFSNGKFLNDRQPVTQLKTINGRHAVIFFPESDKF